ncbi:MAG TPA: hypothetical protein VGD52_00200 [Pseudoduganella sp.]
MSIVSIRTQRALTAAAFSILATLQLGTGLAQVPHDVTHIQPTAILSLKHPLETTPVREHSPIQVPFRLEIRPGLAGAKPTIDVAVCEENTNNCLEFPRVTPPWTSPLGSKLPIRAPVAGAAMPITFVACVSSRDNSQVLGCGHQLASGNTKVDVAMSFSVFFDSFTIQHTRAHNKDTTFYYLAGVENRQKIPEAHSCSGKLGPFIESNVFCLGPTSAGDISDGTHKLSNIRVGEFEWVPGSTKSVTFAFATVNYGTPRGVGPVVDMRSIALNHVLSKLDAPNSGVLEDFTSEINDLDGWRGCDGPTAAGAKRIFNFRDSSQQEPTIDELTRDSGEFTTSSKKFVVPSQTGCGGSSVYQVRWTVKRNSWKQS